MLQSTFNYKDFLKTSAKGLDPADKQMAFQAVMSDSAHQREIADLKAAGLNPVLSASGGSGASTPSGSYDAEQEYKDLMSIMNNSVGGAVKVASKAVDNSAKTVQKTADTLEKTLTKSPLNMPRRHSDFDRAPILELLKARPMDVYASPSFTGRSQIRMVNDHSGSSHTSSIRHSGGNSYTYNPYYDYYPGKRIIRAAGKMIDVDVPHLEWQVGKFFNGKIGREIRQLYSDMFMPGRKYWNSIPYQYRK